MSGAGDCERECAVCLKKEPDIPLLNCAKCGGRRYCGAKCQKSDWPTHRLTCRAPNYILKVTLEPHEIKNPSITRTLSCPASASFFQLHKALQIAFGWDGSQSFAFRLRPPGSSLTRFLDFPVQPERDLLQIVDDDTEDEEEELNVKEIKASDIRLGNVLSDKTFKDAVFQYEYDFQDCWVYEIVEVGRAAATDRFSCVSGEGHGAPEEVGGFAGWEELKEAYRATKPTEQQKEFKKWFERRASNRDLQGLGGGRVSVWDQDGVNLALARMRMLLQSD